MRLASLPVSLVTIALGAIYIPTTTAFSCSTTVSNVHYNLNGLTGVKQGSVYTETPPTRSEARFRLELCSSEGLTRNDDEAEEDQCSPGTRMCLTHVNHKETSDEPVRVVAVVPIWPADLPDHDVELSPLGKSGRDGLNIYVSGADFAGTTQHVNMTLLCSDTSSEPSFISYTAATLNIEWSTKEACPRSNDDDDSEPIYTEPEDQGDSGGGWGFWGMIKFLFWMVVLGLAGYFAIGIFYNRQQYSAKGWDLLPHRDFWREVPVMLSDLFAHLFAGIRGSSNSAGGGGGSGRGGYSSLG